MADDMAKVIARAWSDPDFKARLTSDPKAALAETGIDMPDGVTIKVWENNDDTQHLVLPSGPPSNQEISLDELEKIAGGMGCFGSNNVSC